MRQFTILLLLLFPIFAYGETKKVAILETVDKEGNVPYALKLMVRSSLSTAIAETPGYEAYDRVDVASILGEHEFQRTGLIKEDDIKRLGEMTGAAYILVAEVAYLNETTIIILSKFLNVETAKIESSSNVYSSTSIENLDKNCKIMARKLLRLDIETGAVKDKISYNGGSYVGEILNGQPNGKGILTFASGDELHRVSYDGFWKDGNQQGEGSMIWENGDKYVGFWENGNMSNKGSFYWADGSMYVGEWKKSKRNGVGVFYYAPENSSSLVSNEGNWVDNKEYGQRTIVWKDGTKYVGSWDENKRNGQGTDYYLNGDKLVGTWSDNKRNGKMIWYYNTGDREECQYKDGILADGEATYYWASGEYMTGLYSKEEKDGKWLKRNKDGSLICTIFYKNGKIEKTKSASTDKPKGIVRKTWGILFGK